MLKKQKEKLKKPGKSTKEFLPSNLKNSPRDQTHLVAPLNFDRQFTALTVPHPLPEEWPTEELVKVIC